MLKMDISDLINKTPAINKMVEQKVVDVAAKVTLYVHANVVIASPVDTGAFRSAWTVETPTKPFENGKVENTTPYGPELLNGHSNQAPKGWIDNAVLAATRL